MVALMLKECLILQARLLSQNNHHDDGLSDDRRNCAWIVASNLTPRLPQRNITAGDVEHILERVKEALDLDKIQNKMLAHTDISNRRVQTSTVKSAIESAAKRCPPSRTNLNYSPWEMFIFVRRKTTWEYIHISHVCYKDDAGEVTIQSTVYHEENSSDTAHFSFQEVKQALIDILDDYSRQYHDLGTGSITPCPSGGLCRQIAYLASVQLFGGREDGKVVPDELLQNFETYVKTYIENSSTETTSTLIECGKCHTWNVSPGGFIFRKSDQFFLGRTCYGGSSHGNALFLSKKRKISKRESQESATERFVAELWSSSEVTDSFRLGNDLISDPPDTKFKTKDNWGETCIDNSMVDRQSPNYLIPPGIIGSPLTCRKPKPAFINECPWCEQVFSVNGEYDLLSDLHNFNFKMKDTKQFVSHEKNGSCVFWGLRIHRAIKCVPRITDQPLIRLRIFKSVVSVLGYGPTRISTEKHYICYEDTETKDSFLRKIYQIFCKDEDFLNETSHNPSEWTGKVSDLIFFSFEFRERTSLKPKPELWRRLTKYYLGQLHQAIVCRVGSWPFNFDDSTRVRLVCDANLSLFNYYYFWYASLFYKVTFADLLLPIRDIGMEQRYTAQQVPVPVMKGLHELQDKGSMSLFRYSHPHEFSIQSTTPHPQEFSIDLTSAEPMATGRLWRNGVGYIVPFSVVKDFPYWLGGWECLLCRQNTVVSIKNHCFECKKVFCYTCIQNKNGSNFVRETDPDTGSEIDRCTACSVRLGNQSQQTDRMSKQLLASSHQSVTQWRGSVQDYQRPENVAQKQMSFLVCDKCNLSKNPMWMDKMDEAWKNELLQTTKWWSSGFINSFGTMLAHSVHKTDTNPGSHGGSEMYCDMGRKKLRHKELASTYYICSQAVAINRIPFQSTLRFSKRPGKELNFACRR